jgi:hypothetical protein
MIDGCWGDGLARAMYEVQPGGRGTWLQLPL